MRPYWTLACVGIVLGCAAVAGADEVAAPWGTIHGNNSGTASSDHATMVFDASTWSFGATEAWSVDLDAAGIRRTAFWSSITFDEDGNLYWKGHESTSGAADSQVVSVAPDGTARWTGNDGAGGDHFVGSTSTDSVVVGDGGSSGRVYALGDAGTTDSGFVVAYSKLDGSAQWLTTLPGSKFSGTDVGARRLTPVLYNGKLYVVGAFQFPGPVVKVYQIDSTTGILDWSADLTAGFSGITVNYRGQMTLVPDAFGAGKHGLYFNGSSGNGNDTKNEMNALELDTTANSASIKWSAEGGHVTRSHVMHLALGAAGPTDDRVCTHTWTDFGAELYCWDLDGLNPVADNNQPDSGHGFYDVGCVDFDGDDIIAGGFDGRIIRYQDVLNVGTDGVDPLADVYYQMEEWWGEPRTIGGLYQDASGNSILITGTNSRGDCANRPPGSLGECLGETGYEARVFAVDLTNGIELPNCTVVDDGPAYIDNFTITGGPDAGTQTTILDVGGFEAYPPGDVPTNGTNPGGTAPAGFTWDSSPWTSSNGVAQIVADPTATSTNVLMLDAFQGCYDYQGIFGDVGGQYGVPSGDWVVIVSWDQYRQDTWDNLYMAEHPNSDAWWAIQWDVPAQITPRQWTLEDPNLDPAPSLTAGQWEHIEYKFDFSLSEVTVTVNGTDSAFEFLDPFASPPETSIRGWVWNLEGGEWTLDPNVAVVTPPIFAHNTSSVQDHAFTLRGGPLLGPTVGAGAEQHIYYFRPANPDFGLDSRLVALKAIGQLIDCNTNGIPDSQDIANGTSFDCNGNNIPDECDLADGTLHDVTQPGGGGPNGWPDECEDVTGPQVVEAKSYKVHGTALGDFLRIEMDQQINLDVGTDPAFDAIYMESGGTMSFETDGSDGWTRVLCDGATWYHGPHVDFRLSGDGPIAVAGGGTLEFDARYFNDAGNDAPYDDAPIFVSLYTDDDEGNYVGHREYGIVYQTGPSWLCTPLPRYPTWVHVSIDLGDLAGDPNCDGIPDVAEGGEFDPTRVTRVEFYGTDWFGHGLDYVDIKNLEINTNTYPNRLPIDVGTSGTECRQGGPTEVVLTFDEDVFGVGGLSNDDVTTSNGTVTNVSADGAKLTIEMTGTTDGQMLTLGFPGIEDGLNNISSDSHDFGVLLGDSQGDMDVDLGDWALFQSCFTGAGGGPIGPACASADYIADGDVELGDHAVFMPAMTGP